MDIREEHDKLRNYWDQRAKPWDLSSASSSYLTDFYEHWKPQLKGPYIDIGCGSGKFLFRLAKDGVTDIYGCDISSRLVEITREKLVPLLDTRVTDQISTIDMLDLSKKYPPIFFQTIIFSGVLQQTLHSAARPTLEEIAKIAAPGAIMYISTRSISTPPKDGNPVKGEKGTFRLADGVIKSYFTRASLIELVKGLFEIIELEEKDQTEKITGEKIKNWEGVLRRL